MNPPTIEWVIGWAFAIGAGVGIAVVTCWFVLALFDIHWGKE